MSEHDLDRVIRACHAARLDFSAHFHHTLNRADVTYACDDREILAPAIEVYS